MSSHDEFFRRFGMRVKALRLSHNRTQEDMIEEGFSARHWQQIEAGRSVTVATVLRICESFAISLGELMKGLDNGLWSLEPKAPKQKVGRRANSAKQ